MNINKLNKGDIIECCGIKALVLDLSKENYIKVIINGKIKAAINKDWLDIWKFCNPIKDNRIVSNETFAIRLKTFIEETEVNDPCSDEEKDYLLNVANKLLNYQIDTATDKEEINYLKSLKLL